MTFFQAFNVPVFWPILLMYFIILFVLTMKRQITHMWQVCSACSLSLSLSSVRSACSSLLLRFADLPSPAISALDRTNTSRSLSANRRTLPPKAWRLPLNAAHNQSLELLSRTAHPHVGGLPALSFLSSSSFLLPLLTMRSTALARLPFPWCAAYSVVHKAWWLGTAVCRLRALRRHICIMRDIGRSEDTTHRHLSAAAGSWQNRFCSIV
jgi:hypothetical protein